MLWTKKVYKAIIWSLRISLFQREWQRYSCNSSVGVPKPECEWGPVAVEETSEELGSLWCKGRWLSPSTQRHVQGVMTTGTSPEWGCENLLRPQTQFDSHGSTFSRSCHPCPLIWIPVFWLWISESQLQTKDLCVSSLSAGHSRKCW